MPRGNSKPGKVRIIAGSHRGRTVAFDASLGIRPTHDRVRETLFNWLQPYIQGAYCLDLFSGSGALGFEAASRGAEHVLMCEKNSTVYGALEKSKSELSLPACKIKHINFDENMPLLSRRPYDVVFLDPPYHEGLVELSFEWLKKTNSIHKDSLVYFEMEKARDDHPLFSRGTLFRHKKTTSISFGLMRLS